MSQHPAVPAPVAPAPAVAVTAGPSRARRRRARVAPVLAAIAGAAALEACAALRPGPPRAVAARPMTFACPSVTPGAFTNRGRRG